MDDATFARMVLSHWRRHGRHDLPWRTTTDPYRILVSEVMLQQTQVARVLVKYPEFLRAFPTFRSLARADARSLLRVWQGLGYNRRALALRACARVVVKEYRGVLPRDQIALRRLPGIGPYTAGALMAFAFNLPFPMIETNIRRVMLHHFFPDRTNVRDAEILPVVARTLYRRDPRRWFWALMDYGAWMAKREVAIVNPNRRSKHYTRQAPFQGSDRQLRGEIIRVMTHRGTATIRQLQKELPDARLVGVLVALERDGLLRQCQHARCVHNRHWSLCE